jgi:hypothetical protein
MDAGLLETLLGGDRTWSPACVVVLDADAAVRTPGPDHILGGGVKTYAPRYATGRIEADACCLLKDRNALLVVQQQTYKDGTGRDVTKQALLVADVGHVVGLEFASLAPLQALGVPAPLFPDDHEYRPGTLVG